MQKTIFRTSGMILYDRERLDSARARPAVCRTCSHSCCTPCHCLQASSSTASWVGIEEFLSSYGEKCFSTGNRGRLTQKMQHLRRRRVRRDHDVFAASFGCRCRAPWIPCRHHTHGHRPWRYQIWNVAVDGFVFLTTFDSNIVRTDSELHSRSVHPLGRQGCGQEERKACDCRA